MHSITLTQLCIVFDDYHFKRHLIDNDFLMLLNHISPSYSFSRSFESDDQRFADRARRSDEHPPISPPILHLLPSFLYVRRRQRSHLRITLTGKTSSLHSPRKRLTGAYSRLLMNETSFQASIILADILTVRTDTDTQHRPTHTHLRATQTRDRDASTHSEEREMKLRQTER